MTKTDDELLEIAHRVYEAYGQSGDAQALRLSDGHMRAIIAAVRPGLEAQERELLEDVAFQFAYKAHGDERRWLYTAGLSTLEAVFDALGWDDPHYVEEGGCEHPGCTAWDTCGTPTGDGYKRLCSDHYFAATRSKQEQIE